MSQRVKNFNDLKLWVGRVPAHGWVLGVQDLIWDGCQLLCHRTVADVEAMQEAIALLIKRYGTADWEHDGLPSPGYNSKLRHTEIWRLVDEHYEALSKDVAAERWEFIAAYALLRIRYAIRTLREEPVGITARRVPGERAQRAVASANRWLGLAQAESRRKDVEARKRLIDGGKSGSKSKYRQEGVAARYEQIRQAAKSLWANNPALTRNSIALRLEAAHHGEPGWNRRTINEVLKKNPNK